MARELKRNLVVQWRTDGEWFSGRRTDLDDVWSPYQRKAKRFTSKKEFKEYELTTFGCNWPNRWLRFVRLVPRGASK